MILQDIIKGSKVFDSHFEVSVRVEKISEAGFVVLDKTFGASTGSEQQHSWWLQKYKDDGRYSLSFDEAEKRLNFTQK